MPRVKSSVASRKARKLVLKQTKGFRGRSNNAYRVAKTRLLKSLSYATRDRKQKKRNFRSLWITRIGAALGEYGLSYSKFIHLLDVNNVKLNRLILSNLAIEDPEAFKSVVELVK